MFDFIRQLFRQTHDELNPEIPRYPPFAKGLPSVREDRLLTTQQELVDKLRQTLPFQTDQFDKLMLPVIKRYAAFVHLLPASETHHHRGAGGLLHHGLEVALIAARSSEDVMFAPNEEPRRRRELEPRWRLAVCLAGLTHDVGKPVSDLSVTDSTGERVWNAYTENLADWTSRESVDRYFLHWHKARHRRHEQFSVLVMERVLTRECLNWLSQYGPEIPHALLNSVAMADTEPNDIGPLIRRADNTSVERDMKRYQAAPNESLGVPVERYIVDAMRRLISQGKWQVNEKGSRVWMLNDGLHVVWPAAAHEITHILQRDNVPGIPRDPDSIADILIDRGLAQSRQTESTTYRYWPMRPASFDDSDPNRLMMLRLAAPDMLFSEPPIALDAEVIESRPKPKAAREHDKEKPKVKAGKASQKKYSSEPVVPEQIESSDAPNVSLASVTTRNESASEGAPEVDAGPATASAVDEQNSPEAQLALAMPYLTDDDDEASGFNDPPADDEAEMSTVPADPESADAQSAQPRHKRTSKRRRSRRKGSEQKSETADAAPEAAIDFGAGHAEPILQSLYANGAWETHLFSRNGQVIVSYPDGAALGGTPTEVQRILADEGLLQTDPLSPMLKVRTCGEVKGLMLTQRVAGLLLNANNDTAEADLGENEPGGQAQVSPEPEPNRTPVATHGSQTTAQQPDEQDQAEAKPVSSCDTPTDSGDRNESRPPDAAKLKPPQEGENQSHGAASRSDASRPGLKSKVASSPQASESESVIDASEIAQGLIDLIRDSDTKIPSQREVTDGWIHVSQIVIQWYASRMKKIPAATVRAAISNHPDIALEGQARIGIRELSRE